MTGPRVDAQPAVIDASVALKWVLDDEQDVQHALALRDDFLARGRVQLFAPSLYLYEVVNGITTAITRQRLEHAKGKDLLQSLLLTEIALRVPSIDRMYEIALDYGLSAYDSSYVSLAEALGGDLWTADRQLYDAVRKKLPWVRWIGDYSA
jgi:predicted nucleic acid-binding protein